MKYKPFHTGLLCFCLSCSAFTQVDEASLEHEKIAIQERVEATYIEVLYNGNKDLDLLRKGFHPEFNMYVYYKNEVSKRSREEWIDKISEVRQKPKTNTSSQKAYSWEFRMIDVSGTTAMVVLEIFENGHPKYTDYLTLYKMQEGWQVMTKLFSMH